MNRLTELLKLADQINTSSTMPHGWFVNIQKSVSRARIHRRIVRIGSVTALVVAVLFGGTGLYAQGVSVDHPLYPVKQLGEHAIILITPNSNKAFVYRHLIDRRVEEAKTHPERSGLVLPSLNQLLAEQELVVSQQNEADALSQTIAQATMFEQDVERLRNIRQAESIALALALHQDRLLERFRNQETLISNLEQIPNLPPLSLLLAYAQPLSTPTPESIFEPFQSLQVLRETLLNEPSPNPQQLVLFLKTKNDIRLKLIHAPK